MGSRKCRLLPRGGAEAERCYEAGGDSGFISKGPVPQYLSVQSSALEGSEVRLRAQIKRQAHRGEVKLESWASESGSESGPERVTSVRHCVVTAQHFLHNELGLRSRQEGQIRESGSRSESRGYKTGCRCNCHTGAMQHKQGPVKKSG